MNLKDAKRLYACTHCCKKNFKKKGTYYRKASRTYIPRYFCFDCKKHFSTRTLSKTFRQKRPDLNQLILNSLTSGTSMRKTAFNLKCSYLTVYRKFLWLSQLSYEAHQRQKFSVQEVQIDEMESIEHTKLKPLTIAMAVSEKYHILGIKVGTIPAKGHLAKISAKKYGLRENESTKVMSEMLKDLNISLKNQRFFFKSDAKPSYRNSVQKIFPKTYHQTFIASENKEKRRELKYTSEEKRIFDPLFAINQRIAKFRDHVKRLTRRSWCTTKLKENLEKHLYLYIAINNGYQII